MSKPRQTDPRELETLQADYYRNLFATVRNPEDWKAPVDAVIPKGIAGDVCRAVEFMTATEAVCQPAEPGDIEAPCVYGKRGDWLRVRAVGYRAGPAGP